MTAPSTSEHPSGGYTYIPAIPPYSGGVRAHDGHRIVHVTFRTPPPWQDGFAQIDRLLADHGRPASALCSVELRCPEPHTFDGFAEFNDDYRAALDSRGLLLEDGENPIARTNVAPVVGDITETLLYGFGFTVEDAEPIEHPSFVIAGAGDLRDQADLTPEAIVRAGQQWLDAGAERAEVVLDEMESRMQALGVQWGEATMVDVYTAEPLHHVLGPVILDRMGSSAVHGVHWHLSAPPITGLTFEMDLRGGTVERWR